MRQHRETIVVLEEAGGVLPLHPLFARPLVVQIAHLPRDQSAFVALLEGQNVAVIGRVRIGIECACGNFDKLE